MHAVSEPPFQALLDAEKKHFWFRARNQVLAALFTRLERDLPAGYRVLEVGCGNGNVLGVLERVCARGEVIGTDLFEQGLELARARVGCEVVQADVYDLPFTEPFDFVGLFDVLEHLEDDERALTALRRQLTPSGRLVLTVPAHAALWSYSDVAAGHFRRYSRASLRGVLSRAGFTLDYLTPFMASLLPLIWLGRRVAAWRERFAKRKRSEMEMTLGEFHVNPVVNAGLSLLLRPEPWVVARGGWLPFGASLLAVASVRREEVSC